MTTTTVPYHQAQIVRTLPAWTRTLHPKHISRIVQGIRKDYLDENGSPDTWFAIASAQDQAQVRRQIALRDARLKALRAALKDLRQIGEFCKPLLERRLPKGIDVDKAQYLHQPFKVYTTQQNPPGLDFGNEPERINRPDGPAQRRSLLEAALHNFQGPDDPGPFDALTPGPDSDAPLPGLELQAFVSHCRDLDLGRQYQEHLQSIYDGPAQATIQRLWIDASRQTLNTEAEIAALKNLLTAKGRAALSQLCDSPTSSTPRYGEHALQCWRLSLFDIPIHDVLLIGPDEASQFNPCILYVPNDSEHPVREFASSANAHAHLRQRMLQTSFRQHLISFADKDNQAELSRRLDDALFEIRDAVRTPRKEPALRFNRTRLALPVWPVLFHNHKRRLKADARAIAVPTADADAKARKMRLQQWLDEGMNLLNVAAFFVPGLDAVMLGMFAYDLMDSVFTGFEAWEEGDTHQVLQQLESLAINTVVAAGFAGGGQALKASGFVDALESVWKGGKEVLWHPDMTSYFSDITFPEDVRPDAEGLYHYGGKTYVQLDGQPLQVIEERPGHWHARHPTDATAYSPRLHGNGQGAWRLAHEHPHDWSDAQLLRRLTPFASALDDAELTGALHCSGIDIGTVRRVHLTSEAAPARLLDTLQRLTLDREADQIVESVRQDKPLLAYKHYALPELLKLPGWPDDHVLKVFQGPEPFGTHARMGAAWAPGQVEIEITLNDLEHGGLCQAVTRQLSDDTLRDLLADTPRAQQAKALASKLGDQLQGKHAAVFDSLLASNQLPLEPAQAALGRHFPRLPRRVLQEIVSLASPDEQERLTLSRVPLRIAEQARLQQAHVRLDRALLGLLRPSLASADSLTLDAALQAEFPTYTPAQRFELIAADRAKAARLLGQRTIKPRFVAPSRLPDDRLGYPLAGWKSLKAWAGLGQQGIEQRRLQRLYPTLDATERNALLATLRQRGNVGEQITALEREQLNLDDHLRAWVEAGTSGQKPSRARLREMINRAWRRDYAERLTLEHMHIETLPSLPARMDHIVRLDMDAIGLEQMPSDFLQSFPNLRHLSVTGNPHLQVPSLLAALASTRRLRALDLSENALAALVISEGDTLASLPDLRSLALDGNPLENLSGLEHLTRLATLNLNGCGLSAWPGGLTELMERPAPGLQALELNDNALTEIPDLQRVLQSPFVTALRADQEPTRWRLRQNDLTEAAAQQLAEHGVQIEANRWLLGASQARRALWSQLFEHDGYPFLENLMISLADIHARGIEVDIWPLLEKISVNRSQAASLHNPDLASHMAQRLENVAQRFAYAQSNMLADALSSLQVLVDIHAELVTPGHIRRMFKVMRQLYARESVNACARAIHEGRQASRSQLEQLLAQEPHADISVQPLPLLDPLDDIAPDLVLRDDADLEEIRLSLREELADILDFPEPGPAQWFGAAPPLSGITFFNVEQHVLSLLDDHTGLRAWVAQHPDWRIYLRVRFAERFEALSNRWVEVMNHLEDMLRDPSTDDRNLAPETRLGVIDLLSEVLPESPLDASGRLQPVALNEGDYLAASNLTPARLEQEQAALITQLTAEADPD